MVGAHHQEVALHLLVDLLPHPVVHVRLVPRVEFIDDDPLCQLDGQPVLVDCDLLHQIAALDPHFLLSQQVLYDHVGHVLSVSVALSVKSMDRAEDQLVIGDRAILATDSDVRRIRSCRTAPHPRALLAHAAKLHPLPGVEQGGLVRAADHEVLALGEVGDAGGVEAEVALFAHLLA